MKVVLYMAVSADGFIAGPNDETPWSDEEWEAFKAFVRSCDGIVLGRRTYEIMSKGDEFVDGPEYFVATHDTAFDTGKFRKITISSKSDLPEVKKLGVIGGGELNGRLAKLGVIDEIILDVEPIILGAGKTLFGNHELDIKLKPVASRRIGASTIQARYEVHK
jgi:dihydrofolate reductase